MQRQAAGRTGQRLRRAVQLAPQRQQGSWSGAQAARAERHDACSACRLEIVLESLRD